MLARGDSGMYGTKNCQYTQEMREWLEWKGTEFSNTMWEPIPRPAIECLSRKRTTHGSHARRRQQRGPDRMAGTRLHRERGVIWNGDACPSKSMVWYRPWDFVRASFVWRAKIPWQAGYSTESNVEIFLEGPDQELERICSSIKKGNASRCAHHRHRSLRIEPRRMQRIYYRESERNERLSVRISPDLPDAQIAYASFSILRTNGTSILISIARTAARDSP